MTEELVLSTLKELVEFVKGAAPFMWEIAMRQVWVWAMHSVVVMVISAGGLVGMWRLWIFAAKYKFEGYSASTNKDMALTCIIGGACAGAITMVFAIGTLLGYIINPNYYAIKALAEMFGG